MVGIRSSLSFTVISSELMFQKVTSKNKFRNSQIFFEKNTFKNINIINKIKKGETMLSHLHINRNVISYCNVNVVPSSAFSLDMSKDQRQGSETTNVESVYNFSAEAKKLNL